VSPRRGRRSAQVTDSTSDTEASPSPRRGRLFARRGRSKIQPTKSQIVLLQEENDSESARAKRKGATQKKSTAATKTTEEKEASKMTEDEEASKTTEEKESLSEDDVPLKELIAKKKLVVKVSSQQ